MKEYRVLKMPKYLAVSIIFVSSLYENAPFRFNTIWYCFNKFLCVILTNSVNDVLMG